MGTISSEFFSFRLSIVGVTSKFALFHSAAASICESGNDRAQPIADYSSHFKALATITLANMKVVSMYSLSRPQARTGSVAVLAAAAASAACALVFDDAVESDDVEDKRYRLSNALPNMAHAPVSLFRYQPALCESSPFTRVDQQAASSNSINVASRGRRLLNYLGIVNLPVPRVLTPIDPKFSYPEMKAGIRQRAKDEAKLRSLQTEAIEARNSGDTQRINAVFAKISSIAYGVGVKPQDREDFLVKYGCTGWTDDIIKQIIELGKDRGVVEVGAGNGQWSKKIQDTYKELCASGDIVANRTKNFDFILPFDDMSELPLSPQVYHRHTAPAREHFAKVQKSSHVDALRNKWETRGRVLLLVYPPPGPMAIESVQAYLDVYPEGNDTLVYVGEGRGGANANDAFFDYICADGSWAVENIMNVEGSPGGKGYEKCFVLRRIKK